MQKTTQAKAWKNKAIRKAEVISDTFEVFKIWLGHIANWVLFGCLIFNIIQTVTSMSGAIAGSVLIIQCVMLDVAGTSLYSMSKHAKSQGNEEGAKLAMVMSIILLTVMTVTALSATASWMLPSYAWLTQIVDHVLIFVRIAIVVAYGFVVHQISTLSEMHDNRIEELEAELHAKTNELNALTINLNAKTNEVNAVTIKVNGQLNAKTEELNAATINLNGQLNSLQQRLNAKDEQVNALTIKVNAQVEEIHTLGVKLDHKEAQLTSIRDAHNSSQETTQEAQSRMKSSLTDARREMESLRSELLSTQGSLQAEKQKALTLTTENERLNGQLNAKTEELHAATINLNGQLNSLQQRLNAKDQEVNALLHERTDEPDTSKIVQLDAEVSYEARIRSLLESEPGLSGGEISRRLGCSIPTACNWKKRIENERKEA